MTFAQIIRRNSAALSAHPTGVKPKLGTIEGIRAVLFDVYGTLFVSASGDIGLASGTNRADAAHEACKSVGLMLRIGDGEKMVAALHDEIRLRHARSDNEFPEVDIVEVWQCTLDKLASSKMIVHTLNANQVAQLAIEYETRVNPVWPMPGLVNCLDEIRKSGLVMGIVSNAQKFTRDLFPALTGSTADELGFADDLCVWSYEHLQAKPDRYLYEVAADALVDRGVEVGQALYVGNDMRNDIAPAAAVGFRTALFAGDARSLRMREGDPMVDGVVPEAIVTSLRQILDILCLASPSE